MTTIASIEVGGCGLAVHGNVLLESTTGVVSGKYFIMKTAYGGGGELTAKGQSFMDNTLDRQQRQ